MYHGYTLQYNERGELWFVTEQTWTLDEYGFCLGPQAIRITEFRGNGRQRYMVRERDPAFALDVLPGTSRWSDYDGDEIYGDYVVDDVTGDVTNTMAYLPGVAQMDSQTGEIVYFHGDQIGSVRAVSDEQSAVSGTMVYTAFGEPVFTDGSIGTRYGYAGAWGYQAPGASDPLADLGWLHVGHRYYAPELGRFVQRDTIGIWGGLNVYEYVRSKPLNHIDPTGLIPSLGPEERELLGAGNTGLGGLITIFGGAKWAFVGPWTACLGIGLIGYEAYDSANDPARRQHRLGKQKYGWVWVGVGDSITNSIDGWKLLSEWFFEYGRYKRRPPGLWGRDDPILY